MGNSIRRWKAVGRNHAEGRKKKTATRPAVALLVNQDDDRVRDEKEHREKNSQPASTAMCFGKLLGVWKKEKTLTKAQRNLQSLRKSKESRVELYAPHLNQRAFFERRCSAKPNLSSLAHHEKETKLSEHQKGKTKTARKRVTS